MNLKTAALLLMVGSIGLLAVGCALEKWVAAPETWEAENKLQAELFLKCLGALPAGPQAWKYNDWNEIVSWCGAQARHGVAVRDERVL